MKRETPGSSSLRSSEWQWLKSCGTPDAGVHVSRTVLYSVLLSTLMIPRLGAAQAKPAADLIVTNAKIWTVDKSLPTAQAVAVLLDRIVAVGSNKDVDAWRGTRTH